MNSLNNLGANHGMRRVGLGATGGRLGEVTSAGIEAQLVLSNKQTCKFPPMHCSWTQRNTCLQQECLQLDEQCRR